MPFDRFQRYCKHEGFCCPLALLSARTNWDTVEMAEDSGLTERAVRYWRRLFRKKKLPCPRAQACLLKDQKTIP